MNYYSKTVYFVHDLYPLVSSIQLHQQIMESQSSTTTTSTKTKQDNMPSSQSTSVDKISTTSNANPTLSIPNPAYSPLIQQHVTNAAAIIASNHLTRNMFIVEVFKKCSEIALWEKKTGKTAPELLPESPKPTGESPHSSHNVQHITPEGDDVLNRYIKKYSMPKISTNTVIVSSTLGEETPSTTTSNPTEGSTSHAECRRTNRRATVNKTSSSMMKNEVEQSLPNQAKTLFAPVGIAEDLARIQLILCEEIKTEIQAVKKSIAAIPFDDRQRKITEATTQLEERMTRLEEQCHEMKGILKQKTILNYIANPALLEHWKPGDMVNKHSLWTTLRLVLNKVASENSTELFPSDGQPRPSMSTEQQKQYKVLTEVMTEMFHQCGFLSEAEVIELDNYEDFLKVLHHHTFMGNVSTIQLTHFIMLMVYMSFCRLNYYTKYMRDEEAVLLKIAVQMTLVIMAFKTTFSMKGGHKIINSYFKILPSEVRRNLHVITTRYMEQECTCQNHVQCDINPTQLTSQVVLPSYEHFLQHLQLTSMNKKISSETDVLSQYGKTILMLILARVNGYYNPYIPQTIMEEEAKIMHGEVFSPAEKEFFKHRLQTLYPKIGDSDVKTAINLLAEQKAANCPCLVHTDQRDYEWIVFKRQPDRISYEDEEGKDETPMNKMSDDEDLFSDEIFPVDQDIQDEIIEVTTKTTSEEADFSSAELSVGCKTTAKPQMSESMCEPSLHSRDKAKPKSATQKESEQKKMKNDSKLDDTPMDLEIDTKEDEKRIPLSTTMKEKGIWLYCTSTKGKTYYFKYFKAYAGDHRMLVKDDYGEPIKCHCPEGKIHHVQCPWYHPDVIYIIDFQEDLSSIELAAQQKIYNIYKDTIHNPPENCGCGTAAEVAYMGHNTACFKFKYIHERESYEVLLAILQKTEKVTGCPTSRKKKPRLQSSKHDAKARGDSEEIPVVQKVPRAKEVPFNLS